MLKIGRILMVIVMAEETHKKRKSSAKSGRVGTSVYDTSKLVSPNFKWNT